VGVDEGIGQVGPEPGHADAAERRPFTRRHVSGSVCNPATIWPGPQLPFPL
jgi:hypothetical protein